MNLYAHVKITTFSHLQLIKIRYGQINLIISSDEVGVFIVEASFLGVRMPEKLELRLEDLLQQQYNGVNVSLYIPLRPGLCYVH